MPTDRPNVVVFFTDQQRHDTTGVHGCPLGLTPNFDRLARAGTDVHYSFTCQPVCGPARACLQTGTHATTNGSFRNGIGLTRELPHLADQFRQAGYHTGYFGKWHLADDHDTAGPVPAEQRGGYEHWLAANLLEMTSDDYHTRLWDADNQPIDLPGYRVDALTDALIRHIDDRRARHPDQPFFLFTSYLEPHHQNHVDAYPPPMGTRADLTGRWCPPDLAALPTHEPALSSPSTVVGGSAAGHLGGYFGMVQRLDDALGRLVDALHSLGQLDNTVILFTADHACHFKTRNREYKRSGHEASIRVPTMLHGGPFRGGGRVEQLVSLVDLPATLLDAAGIAAPDTFEGRSLLPLLRRDPDAIAAWPDDMYVQVSEADWGRALRTRRWKYIVHEPADRPDRPGVSDEYHEAELYDLRHDPHELVNLITFDSHAPVRAVMRDRLKRRLAQLHEPDARIVEPRESRPGGQFVVTPEEAKH
jgi:arylsulfatase A-like enzyme